MTEMLVSIKDLKIRRGDFVLDIPAWEIEAGHIVGLVGANGAGKSTLLECLAGFLPADVGKVSVFGHTPWQDVQTVRSQLGFMSDTMPVFDVCVGELLSWVAAYYETWDNALVRSLVERFSLDLNARPSTLSKGQATKLRLILAMAFVPRLLLLDEPALGLDLSGRRSLLEVVLDIARDGGRTVVVSSHRLEDVERLADQLVVLCEGRIVKQGATDDLVGEERTLEEALLSWGVVS